MSTFSSAMSALKKSDKIVVIGAGPGGGTQLLYLSKQGYTNLWLYTPPDHLGKSEEWRAHGLRCAGDPTRPGSGWLEHKVRVDKETADEFTVRWSARADEAFPGAVLVINMANAEGHLAIFSTMAEQDLRSLKALILTPCFYGTSSVLQALGSQARGMAILEIGGFPYITTHDHPDGGIFARGFKEKMAISVWTADLARIMMAAILKNVRTAALEVKADVHFRVVAAEMSALVGALVPGRPHHILLPLELALMEANSKFHPSLMLYNAHRFRPDAEPIYPYREGVTEEVAASVERVDVEYNVVAEQLSMAQSTCIQTINEYYAKCMNGGKDWSNLYAFTNDPKTMHNANRLFPKSHTHRWLQQDLSCGNGVVELLAQALGVASDECSRLMDWGQEMFSVDYRAIGKSGQLGLKGKSLEEMVACLNGADFEVLRMGKEDPSIPVFPAVVDQPIRASM